MFPILVFDEFVDPEPLYVLQVLLQAHVIVLSISIVNPIYLSAGIRGTFKTKSGILFRRVIDPLAFPEEIRASFIFRPAADALASF